MQRGFHAWVIGGLNIVIQFIEEYINVEGASCPFNIEITNVIKVIAEYIEVEGASCLGNRGIKYHYTIYCRIY